MKSIDYWLHQLKVHRKNKKHGVPLFFRDAIAAFLMRFGSTYERGYDYGHLLNAVNQLQGPADSLNYKYALEYLRLRKDTILIRDRRKKQRN